MVYNNNFFLRLLFSAIFLTVYLIFSFISFQYVFYLICLVYFFILIEIFLYFNNYKILPLIYVIISFIFFIYIDFSKEIFLTFNLFILIVITFDIFSYIIGKTFGKNKLSKISPNKTYEGLLGGLIASFSISLLFTYIIYLYVDFKLIIFIIVIILTAFMGDIIESFFKRKNNLKNSSELIPGHGGVFDRFDSFLFSIIFYSISLSF